MTTHNARRPRTSDKGRSAAYRRFLAATTSTTLALGTVTTGGLLLAGPAQGADSDGLISQSQETDTDLTQLLTPVGKQQSRSAQKQDSQAEELAPSDPNEFVVTIVEFDESLSAKNQQTVVQNILANVAALAAEQGLSAAEVKQIEVVQTYDTAFQGVAISMPRLGESATAAVPGVKESFVEQRYEVPKTEPATALSTTGYDLKNESSLVMTGADQSATLGDGTLISIIDTGLDTTHEGFADTLDSSTLRYTQESIDALRGALGEGATATFVSNKVPFAYDYADSDNNVNPTPGADLSHGTHVAGIAAANGGEEVRGTAPNAQVMVQKVFSDREAYATDSWILAALDDAAKIKPDVINMSLGSSAGFTDSSDTLYGSIFAELRKQGVVLSVSAGNSRQAAVNNTSGQNLPYATDPDYGITGSPSTYTPNLSVASINNALARPYLLAGDNYKAYYKPISSADGSIAPFTDLQEGTYGYVHAGLGSGADIEQASATVAAEDRARTILIIDRGSFTFQEKITNAEAFGPAAVIIADNVESTDFLNPAIDASSFPVAVVSKQTGAGLVTTEPKTIGVASSNVDEPDQNFRASAFSSMGVTPELQLKPDIAAPGGNIYSTVPGGYDWNSGTSMAAPQVAGILAAVKQYILNAQEQYGKLGSVAAGNLAQTILVNTAVPLVNPDSANGTYYTPRKQGAGMANVPAAQRTPVYLTVKGAADATRPTASLGESKSGKYDFTFTAHNLTGKAQTYTLDATALSDTIKNGLFLEESTDYTGNGVDIKFSGKNVKRSTLTVPAGKSADIKVTINANSKFAKAVKEAVNGTFIDGFVQMHATDAPSLTIPFAGFYGDWSKAPVFDAALNTEQEHISGTLLYNSTFNAILGVNPLDPQGISKALASPKETIKPERYVLSAVESGGAVNEFLPLTGLLRNAATLDYELVKGSKGKAVKSYSYDLVRKSYYFANEGYITSAEDYLDTEPLFNAVDSKGNVIKDGEYSLVQTAKTAGPGSAKQQQRFGIDVDTQRPQIVDATVVGGSTDPAVRLTLSEGTYLAGLTFHKDGASGAFNRVLTTDTAFKKVKGQHQYQVTVSLAELEKTWKAAYGQTQELPDVVTFFAWDYGMNRTVPVQLNVAQLSAP